MLFISGSFQQNYIFSTKMTKIKTEVRTGSTQFIYSRWQAFIRETYTVLRKSRDVSISMFDLGSDFKSRSDFFFFVTYIYEAEIRQIS